MEEDCNENDLEVEKQQQKLQLIDLLSEEEEDFLIDSCFTLEEDDFRFSVMLEKLDEHEGFKLFRHTDSQEAGNAAEILKQKELKLLLSKSAESGRASNLRRSLAWDSAFFTSEGVLDPEELLIINKGFEKAEAQLLHVIQQDLCKWRSSDSDFTLDGDCFSLESNQSTEVCLFEDIRASIQKSNMTSNVFKSSCKSGVGEGRKQKTSSMKKPDVISRSKVKSMPTSTRKSIHMQASERTKKAIARPQNVQACRSTYYMASPKSSSSVSVAAGNSSTACCSPSGNGSSLRMSSNSRKKTDSRNFGLTDYGLTSNLKTPMWCSSGSKSGLGTPSLSTPLLPLSNHSSFESLASSSYGWSSESSPCSAEQKSNCLEASFVTSRGACLGNNFIQALDLQSHPHDQSPDHQESRQAKFPNQCTEEVKNTSNASAQSTGKFKPSGLRMPSPKIGFFDEEKSSVLPTVSGGFHFGAQSALPNINGTTNRKRPSKTQPANSKPTEVLYPASNAMARCAAGNQKLYKNSPKASTPLATPRNFPRKGTKDENDLSPQLCRSKSKKVGDGGNDTDTKKLGQHSSLKQERKRTKGLPKNEMGRESKNGDFCVRASEIGPSKDEPLVPNEGINPTKKEHTRTTYLYSLDENEKENLPGFEDHVNDLSSCFEAFDLGRDMVTDPKGKKGCFHPHLVDNFLEDDISPISSSFFQFSPNISSKPISALSVSTTAQFMPSTRTPLGDKKIFCNGADIAD